ncbi:hypothetical protein RDWZM_006889 [Blomia tropicalis]|uniref:Lipoprotein n=1 Tax=Blomia tropicalis TaxID=40697 RepID=A0A9Q0M8N3_BLOTA|nr:hypothetical protein RDWZM_006889 [Blomia tropicalis]
MGKLFTISFALILFTIYGCDANRFDIEYLAQNYSSISNTLPDRILLNDFHVHNPAFDIAKIVYTNNVMNGLRNRLNAVSINYNNAYNHEMVFQNNKTYLTGDAIVYYKASEPEVFRRECSTSQLLIKFNVNMPFEMNYYRGPSKNSRIYDFDYGSEAKFYNGGRNNIRVNIPNVIRSCANYYDINAIKDILAKNINQKAISNQLDNFINKKVNKKHYENMVFYF